MTQTLTQDPIALLTQQYGSNLEDICDRHKRYMLACLADKLLFGYSFAESIDAVDAMALVPQEICDSIESLEGLPDHRLLELIGAIAAQLQAVQP